MYAVHSGSPRGVPFALIAMDGIYAVSSRGAYFGSGAQNSHEKTTIF
ncbi:MAG: hypothetical protein ACI9YO_001776 [Gammaproteobacteria bacterium]|jgi:hypothetical protein